VTPDEYRHAALVLGRSPESVELSDVSIRLLMQPGRTPQIARYLSAAKLAIKWFGLWYGPYPYRTLTIVDPPSDAPGAEGMEYPTFITGGTEPLLNWWPFSHVREPEEVVVHEYAHQYWYGLVGTNEFEEAWLDEGFTSYSTGQLMELMFGTASTLIDLPFFKVSERDLLRLTNSPSHRFDRVRQPAWTYSPGEYAFYAYEKPELL
jgi:aminopeptidase N